MKKIVTDDLIHSEITHRELLAIKAVNFGCSMNRKFNSSGTYITDVHDIENAERISFCEAVEVVFGLIDRLEAEDNETEDKP